MVKGMKWNETQQVTITKFAKKLFNNKLIL